MADTTLSDMRVRLAAILSPLLIAAATALGQSTGADVSRVVRQFDFEERGRGNVEDVPMDWMKIEGSGRPHYVNGTLSTDQACSGRYSFRFDLNGGSLVYRYPHGHVQVYPGASYRVSAMVKTDQLPNARARVAVQFSDQDNRTIKGATRHSTPFVSTSGEWTKITVDAIAPENAVWLELELGLLQPSLYRDTSLGNAALFEQDINGRAWFDDVTVAQVPRVRLSTARSGNVFPRREQMIVHTEINDRLTDDLVGQLTVTDAEGRRVYQRSGSLEMGPKDAKGTRATDIAIGELPAGWYHASLKLTSRNVDVADESIDLIQLPDDQMRLDPDPRFGVIATDLPFASWADLPNLLPAIGAARVKLAVWSSEGEVESSKDVDFARVLEALRDQRITPTACLVAPPPSLARAIGGTTWPALLKAPAEVWQANLAHLVARYSGYLDRWQFGLDAEAQQFVSNGSMRKAYGLMHDQFRLLVDKPDLAMPWPAWFDMEGQLPPTIALSVPSDVLPHQLPLYINDLKKSDGQQLSISLQLLSRQQYGRQAQMRDFVQRVAYALSAGAQRIDAPLPFDVVRHEDGSVQKQPQEMLLVLRTLLSTLGGSQYRGRVPIDADVEAFLFERSGGEGVMLVWTKSPSGASKTISVVLGNRPQRVDLTGNTSAVLRPKDAVGTTDIDVGPIPSFVIGIDARLAQLRSSFAFDNPLVESSFQAHTRLLTFTNPYPVAISGRIRMMGPQGWTVTPQAPNFNLNPGETYRGPVSIEFPYNSVAGAKTVMCTVDLQADKTQQIKVPVGIRLGLGDVGLETIALRDGKDVIVQQMITNYTAKPIDYTAFVTLPGQARQERLLQALKPGATIIKKYRFPNITVTREQKVRSGVKETDGTRVLNDEVSVQ